MTERTDAEIVARLQDTSRDFFGWAKGDLLALLSFETAKPLLKDGVTAEQWGEPKPRDRDSILAAARDYMPFAWGKANGERGLSAGRSMDHMSNWLWLAGEDEEWVKSIGLDDYTDYGRPQLRAICARFGWPTHEDVA